MRVATVVVSAAWVHTVVASPHAHKEDTCPAEKVEKRLALTKNQFYMGCDPIFVWEMAQLTKPDAKHFMEAGANLGFYGARAMTLWNHGVGLTPSSLQERLAVEWHGSSSYGTCHDGTPGSNPMPFLCRTPELAAANPYQCGPTPRPEVQYHAFDGSVHFAHNVSNLVAKHWPSANFKFTPAAVMHRSGGHLMFAQRLDEGGHLLIHSELPADKVGFKKKNDRRRRLNEPIITDSAETATKKDEVGQLSTPMVAESSSESAAGVEEMATAEGEEGAEVAGAQVKEEKEEERRRLKVEARKNAMWLDSAAVPIVSVDAYAEEHGLELDVLKVDVEGYDLAVLAGAMHQLSNHLWFVQFEYGGQFFKGDGKEGPGGHNWTSFGSGVEAMDALGYTCYFTGDRYGTGRLLLQITGCQKHPAFCAALGEECPYLPEDVRAAGHVQATKIKKGNDGWGRFGDVVCAHRARSPAFAWALHAAEKRGLHMSGPTRKKLATDPQMLAEIMAELKDRNGGSLDFSAAGIAANGGGHHD